jgi:hypothetical protein
MDYDRIAAGTIIPFRMKEDKKDWREAVRSGSVLPNGATVLVTKNKKDDDPDFGIYVLALWKNSEFVVSHVDKDLTSSGGSYFKELKKALEYFEKL